MATETTAELNGNDNNSTTPQGPNPSQTLEPAAKPDDLKETPNNNSSSGQPPTPSTDSSSADAALRKEDEELKGSTGSGSGDGGRVTDTQKKIRRAERFGITVQLSEQEKRNSRAERFGAGSKVNGSEELKKSEELKRRARAERFGLASTPVVTTSTGEEAKKKARLARFAPASKPDPLEEEKRKARANRFSNPPSNSPAQVNGTGVSQLKTVTADKAGGGAEAKLPSNVV